MRRDFPGKMERFDRWIKIMQGMPIHDPFRKPGDTGYELKKWTDIVISGATQGMLTRAGIVNIPEVALHKGSVFFGAKSAMHGLLRAVGDAPHSYRDTFLRATGAVTKDYANLSFRRTGRARITAQQVMRLASDVLQRATGLKPLNEFQENILGHQGLYLTEEWLKGSYPEGELAMHKEGLRSLFKFPGEMASRMVHGKGTQAEYELFIQRMPSLLVAAKRIPIESSVAMNHPLYKFWVRFSQWTMAMQNTFASHLGGMHEGWKAGDAERVIQNARLLFRNVAYGSAQTLLGKALVLYFGMLFASKAFDLFFMKESQEAKEDPVGYMGELLLDQGLLGPLSGAVKGAQYSESIPEALLSASPVSRVGKEWIGGILALVDPSSKMVPREYRNLDRLGVLERMFTFSLSARRELASFAAVVGLGQEDNDLDHALSYYGWWVKNKYDEDWPAQRTTDFGIHMRKAREEFSKPDGDPLPHLLEALEVQVEGGMDRSAAHKRMAKAIGDRMIFGSWPPRPGTDRYERVLAFQQDSRPWMFEKIRSYDRVLQAWKEAFLERGQR
jgi:hypothetical protein